ncbi:latent-transforming growth factor beta-binding protein 4-like [Dendronephthya gigantea]|uniref:latent-transforming growth factor beta-binding protein 4-like n=1 Tax=Dendronephthya gigantea TaxID=151771 RepID=UPI00106BC983|nr:latent-transforming growth factor beta-binding protein 4-like [Dendronephthya gigantea]
MKPQFALLIFFIIYSVGHASDNSKKLEQNLALKDPGNGNNEKETHKVSSSDESWTNTKEKASKSIAKQNTKIYKKNKGDNLKLKKVERVDLGLKTLKTAKLEEKKSTLGSGKRQNVLTADPSHQRLFHIDETGTLHRHEVGPEEYFTPEGKPETFSNDKLLTRENLVNLRPSQGAAVDASLRQGLYTPLAQPSGSTPGNLPQIQPGAPVAFLQQPSSSSRPITSGPPRRFYLMQYRSPANPESRDQRPSNEEAQLPGLQRVYIQQLRPPSSLPYRPPFPQIFNNNPAPFPVPIATPPEIQKVPYPVPVPVQTPPQIRVQKVPVAVPQLVRVPEVHKVPVPIPVQTPPEIRVQKVPVPVPQPFPVPQPVPYQRPPLMRAFVGPRPIIPVPVGLSECDTNPCRNGGTCYSVDDIRSYRCHCTSGFKGTHCEETSKCHPNPCENLGECTVLKSGFECSCRRGFRGARCEVRDQCHPSPCRNGGSCTSVGNEYACSCIFGFIGKNCEVESKCFPLNPCKHGGICHEDVTSYKCTCQRGWEGMSCETPDPCSRMPCYNGGVCRPMGMSYTCTCPMGYLGKTCQMESQCLNGNPCRNGGKCYEHNFDGYRCHCNNRWTGEHCEIPSRTMYY